MDLVIRPEVIDPLETARLGNEAFGGAGAGFTPERLSWLYDRGFSNGTEVLSLFSGERKVGQVALLRQSLCIEEATAQAVALVDLFILKAFRSREAIGGLYGEVDRLCRAQGVRFLLAVPNGNAIGVNRRLLGMREFLTLDIRAGLAVPMGGPVILSAPVHALDQREAQALFSRYVPGRGNGLRWTAASLWQRLQDPTATYGVHATANLLLVSAKRVLRRVPHTLLCAFLVRAGAEVTRADVTAVTRAACRLHRRPLFVYAGLNAAVPLPGWSLPARLRPSPMIVQIRDYEAPEPPIDFDRFELLDFDFA